VIDRAACRPGDGCLSGMSDVRLTRDLLALGYTHNELAHQSRSGELDHLRRGAYCSVIEADSDPAPRHLRLVEATVRLTAADAVVSHASAAVVHGLPVLTGSLGRVQLTRPGLSGGKDRGGRHLYMSRLNDSEVTEVHGIRTTSLARTVVDVARSLPFASAVVTGDAALRLGLTREDLEECLGRSARRPGMAQARRVAAFLDARSESPGESVSRVVLHTAGVPTPELQFHVNDARGRHLGRTDFGWLGLRTVGEFDGRIKYGRLLRPGETIADVIYAEKLREDAMRDLGWQVVRWCWPELGTPHLIVDRLRRAFARASR
jgi:hypothetical protein